MKSLKGKKVLVTGAGGFIGSHLTERLVTDGADVRAMIHYNSQGHWGWLQESDCRGKIDFYAGDIADRDSVKHAMKDVEYVFHLAALIAIPYSYESPSSYIRTNIDGTMNVVQSAREMGGVRVLHTSTSEVYGTAIRVPINEEHPLKGQSPYSASKIGADKIAESFHLSFEVPVVTIRPFNTFGPRQSARAVIPTIITQCLARKPVKLGHLHPTRDLNFIENIVDGYLKAALSDRVVGETLNLGSGREISIGDLAVLIGELMGVDLEVKTDDARHRPQASEVERLLADSSKANKLLGWDSTVSLEDGLMETISWLEKNMHLYRTDQYVV